MNSVTTAKFQACFEKLPENIQQASRKAYSLWKDDPSHPSLQFKLVSPQNSVYSVRVTLSYRALGVKSNETIIWFWIGSHSKYDELIKSFQ